MPAGPPADCSCGCGRRANSLNRTKAIPPSSRMSNSWIPSKPSPNSMAANRPPAAIPASGPSQRLAPELAAAPGCCWRGAACWSRGACWRWAGWLWCVGELPKLLPPPMRRASASGVLTATISSTVKKGSNQRMFNSPLGRTASLPKRHGQWRGIVCMVISQAIENPGAGTQVALQLPVQTL